MLVLGRRVGETICIADGIEIVVVAIDGGQVRIGVRAPREVPVLRGELRREVAAENQRAVAHRSPAVAAETAASGRRAARAG
ncbi:MAG TPA: carbon storage regulator CsrA [Chloroflexota bacterium]|nr:carbon storage regulator CsrA [Chloroflexota bacterium]